MQKNLKITWNYTWIGNDLFCGAIFFCRLVKCDHSDGQEHFRLEHVAFPDAVSEAGWERWFGQPFDFKAADTAAAIELIEAIYRTVFDRMDLYSFIEE